MRRGDPDRAALIRLLRLAFSAERAATLAYQGHARSVRNPEEQHELTAIANEEIAHRAQVFRIMQKIGASPSRWLDLKFTLIGRVISLSCHVIGWFMPMYFAGRLESGNVSEYVRMYDLCQAIGLDEELTCVAEMAWVEKQHELYFLEKIRNHPLTPLFAWLWRWGPARSFNTFCDLFVLERLRSRPQKTAVLE